MGNSSSYQTIQNNDHLFKISDVTYFDPVKKNMLSYENGKYEKWKVFTILSDYSRQYPVYPAVDEKGVITLYNPEKMHDYYFKKYIESVKQKALDELKLLD